MCGNVFPGDTPGEVFSVLEGPVREWAGRLRGAGHPAPVGFGLYLSATAASRVARSPAKRERLVQGLFDAGVETWTANAFPFGGFHDQRVKERAFLPDWRSRQRLAFTCRVSETLAGLLMPGDTGSVSTCPLGYGPDARRTRLTVDHLKRAQDGLLSLEERRGVRVLLALEPEPDGAFERVDELAGWLDEQLGAHVGPAERRVGVCWDLCHSAVVGESPAEVVRALEATGVPLAKVQISAALEFDGGLDEVRQARLAALTADPYLHQVRGRLRDGRPFASGDLARLLDQPAVLEQVESARIHCHVPVHTEDFGDGLRGTDWRAGLQAARAAGCADFELETYTLPVLPEAYTGGDRIGTMVDEMACCARALDLADQPAGG
jgi:hypothetical protein